MRRIVIIGNGIAGVTAARNIRKRCDDEITIISGETDYFFSRTALMYVYMGHMKFEHTQPYENDFWEKNKINLLRQWIISVDVENKKLHCKDGSEITYDVLVLATGSKPSKYGWPGQDLKGVQGLYSYQDLELMEENTTTAKHAVIVGGGLIGIEMAEMLMSRNIQVTFLVREDSFWRAVMPKEESEILNNHIREHHVDLRLSTSMKEVVDDGNGRVKAVLTEDGEEIPCQFVGITAGVQPNINFLEGSGINTDGGIIINEYFETNIKDVYAIGDCARHASPPENRKAIEQVWYSGKIMGENLASVLCGERIPYRPGIWFNSAKFFDIEYQTYGMVWSDLKEDEDTFFWQHDNGKIFMRFVYHNTTKKLHGINVFGIRMRHEVCDGWMTKGMTIEEILAELADANFDPEFSKRYEKEIVGQYNKEKGANVAVKTKSWKRILKFAGNVG